MVSANPNLKCMVQAWMQCHFCMFYECCAYICHLLLRGAMCLDQDQKHKDVNKTLVWHLFCAAYPSPYLAWLRYENEAYCLAAAAWMRIPLSSCTKNKSRGFCRRRAAWSVKMISYMGSCSLACSRHKEAALLLSQCLMPSLLMPCHVSICYYCKRWCRYGYKLWCRFLLAILYANIIVKQVSDMLQL
jgi:hypothetical protein